MSLIKKEPISWQQATSWLALDVLHPVRSVIVETPDILQRACVSALEGARQRRGLDLSALHSFTLLPTGMGLYSFFDRFVVSNPSDEARRLIWLFYPLDAEARNYHGHLQAMLGVDTPVSEALNQYETTERLIFDAVRLVEQALTGDDVSERDIEIISAALKFDINRDQTYPFYTALLHHLREASIAQLVISRPDFPALWGQFAQETGLRLDIEEIVRPART